MEQQSEEVTFSSGERKPITKATAQGAPFLAHLEVFCCELGVGKRGLRQREKKGCKNLQLWF